MRACDLTGAILDYWVARVLKLSLPLIVEKPQPGCLVRESNGKDTFFSPSTNWEQGGPLIEQERLWLRPGINDWYSLTANEDCYATGDTPLISAMRCLVLSKIVGEELPNEWA